MISLDKKKMIDELDEISVLYAQYVSIESEVKKLIEDKDIKTERLKEKFKTNAELINSKILLKFLKDVESLNLDSSTTFIKVLPEHWISEEKLIKTSEENRINYDMSPERKEERYKALRAYDTLFLSMAKECKEAYHKELEKYQAELDPIETYYETTVNELLSKKETIANRLQELTIISEDIFEEASRISDMLKKGRADTLKEAINLAFDEKRKDEEEQSRQAEAATMAYEMRRHNDEMERAAEEETRAIRAHNAAMERAAQEQIDMLRKSEKQQQDAAFARCVNCANRFICPPERKRAYSCSAYVKR